MECREDRGRELRPLRRPRGAPPQTTKTGGPQGPATKHDPRTATDRPRQGRDSRPFPLLAAVRQHAYAPDDAALFLLSQVRLPEEDTDEEVELPRVLKVAELTQVWHSVIDMHRKTHQGDDKC